MTYPVEFMALGQKFMCRFGMANNRDVYPQALRIVGDLIEERQLEAIPFGPTSYCFYAEFEGAIASFVIFNLDEDSDKMTIELVWTDPAMQDGGLMTYLMSKTMSYVNMDRTISVSVPNTAESAMHFFKKRGWMAMSTNMEWRPFDVSTT